MTKTMKSTGKGSKQSGKTLQVSEEFGPSYLKTVELNERACLIQDVKVWLNKWYKKGRKQALNKLIKELC